jgi:hypothetical protein
MNINFDRFRAQLLCESFFSCSTLEEWEQCDFSALVLDGPQSTSLTDALKHDAVDLYFKGLLSLFESIQSFNNKRYSWGTIKSYYATFYFLRADLAANNIGLIRNKSIYYLICEPGELPQKKRNNRKYGTDHKATLNYYSDLFSHQDILLSQNITGMTAYEWLAEKREQVNYRERSFHDPLAPTFLAIIETYVENETLKELLLELISDSYVLTFQEEFATLGIPLKRALLTRETLKEQAISLSFNDDKISFLKKVIPFKIDELNHLY